MVLRRLLFRSVPQSTDYNRNYVAADYRSRVRRDVFRRQINNKPDVRYVATFAVRSA